MQKPNLLESQDQVTVMDKDDTDNIFGKKKNRMLSINSGTSSIMVKGVVADDDSDTEMLHNLDKQSSDVMSMQNQTFEMLKGDERL